ncbi:uncharacterized protein LOC119441460 [Dermacentor silvarum]|uniref:uncharacterized protein LOC119441460 n=1 Tax=Dermacentor silvarum TaxID=543639 RepID=UPI00189832DD|nr:uncharacterized protein LOC119441460 [Dermacentor silvarum]
MCSNGAVSAAQLGRGNRFTGSSDQDYEFILPRLPTGRIVLNTLFLHADVRARPHKVEDFRDALVGLALLPEVIALGAYQMNHIWAITFKSAEGMKKLLSTREMKLKERRCVVIDPGDQDVRMKIHWILYNVQDEDVRTALAPYGTVTEVAKERWRVQGVMDKGSSTRSVSLKLKPGVTVEDLPHQLRIAGEQALVVVPGRAPLCLRCHTSGHVRRECKVPRCSQCRRFGHDESQCVKTYANVTGPMRREDHSELVMDADEAEEAARTAEKNVPSPASTPNVISGGGATTQTEDKTAVPLQAVEDLNVDAAEGKGSQSASTEGVKPIEDEDGMDIVQPSISSAAAKRTHDKACVEEAQGPPTSIDEPPSKSAGQRRPTFRPKPNIPPDKRPVTTTPT